LVASSESENSLYKRSVRSGEAKGARTGHSQPVEGLHLVGISARSHIDECIWPDRSTALPSKRPDEPSLHNEVRERCMLTHAHVPHISRSDYLKEVGTTQRTSPEGPGAAARGSTFVVKIRDPHTRSWGDQTEVVATSARDAAEQVAGGEHLLEGPGERANLRARVWKTPYGSVPDISFYATAAAPPP
jgi:hypothetical protein